MANFGEKHPLVCGTSELDYDFKRLVQTDIQSDYFTTLTPKGSILATNPLLFVIDGTGDFVDLSRTMLKMTLSMTDSENNPIVAATKAAPINNLANAIIQQTTVTLGSQIVSHPNNLYAHRSYLENLLTYGADSKGSWMRNVGWFSDDAGQLDSENNSGFALRKGAVLDGRHLKLKTRLHTDICFQNRLIPSNLDIKFNLTLNSPEFVIQSFAGAGKKFSLNIVDCTMIVRKVKLFPQRQLTFERTISKSPITIPFNNVQMKTFSLAQGLTAYSQDSVYAGTLPSMVIFGLTDNKALTGDYPSTPFNFKHFSLSNLQLVLNGQNVPSQGLNLDFDNDDIIDGFETLTNALGNQFDDKSNDISVSFYKGGASLYAFNLNPTAGCSQDILPQTGVLDLHIKFKDPLPNTVSLICYSQFHGAIKIDKFRNVLMETPN